MPYAYKDSQHFFFWTLQVRYACKEYAATAVDVIARRLRLSFLNVQAAEECLPRIVDIMAEELKWSKAEKSKQMDLALDFLHQEMGKGVNRASRDAIPISLSKPEIAECVKRFNAMDRDKKGFVTVNDIRQSLKVENKSKAFLSLKKYFYHIFKRIIKHFILKLTKICNTITKISLV